MENNRKNIPSMDSLLRNVTIKDYIYLYGKDFIKQTLNTCIDHIDNYNLSKEELSEVIITKAIAYIEEFKDLELKEIVNGTGIILNTNLGRAPISEGILQKALTKSRGYCSTEIDNETGLRGDRNAFISKAINYLTGAEDALLVNNNAGALMLILSALSKDKEVILSRGELVEIGGRFRLPDICQLQGAMLKEIGTTNSTYIEDYQEAINENSALILKVYKSNFVISGYSKEVSVKDLSEIKTKKLPLVVDMGSGTFLNTDIFENKYKVKEVLKDGADLLCFSGDKILGGCQSGLIIGKKALIDKIKKNPLYRALRVDKLTIAIMEEVLKEYIYGKENTLLINSLIDYDIKKLKKRGNALTRFFNDIALVEDKGYIGGGFNDLKPISSYSLLIKFNTKNLQKVKELFLKQDPKIIVKIENNRIKINLLTVLEYQDKELVKAINYVFNEVESFEK